MVTGRCLLLLALCAAALAKARFRTDCERGFMYAIVDITPDMERLYLHRLKGFTGCDPEIRNEKAIFPISLADMDDFSACGVTKMVNRNTGQKIYYHHVVVEYASRIKESVRIECAYSSNGTAEEHNVVRRSAQNDPWPSGFQEPEILEITSEITATAPTPELSVTVRQDGEVVDTSLNVRPGAPLDMEIFLDSESAGTYGIIVSDMIVSDTKKQEELLLTNGCSVDPYLFGNFKTTNGDNLNAEFRAFKFPETNYVLFKGILNVCIDTCEGVQCSNGEVGYGRKRRALEKSGADPNQVFQVTMSTILSVQFEEDASDLKAGFISGRLEEPYSVGYVSPVGGFARSLTRRDGSTGHLAAGAAALVPAAAALLVAALLAAA